MYATTIKTALNTQPLTYNIFRDVVSADRVPGRKNQWGVYVVNSQPSYNPGEHWFTIAYDPEYMYYFDPYGLPPTKTILQHLEKTRAKKPILSQTSGDKDKDKPVDSIAYITHSPELCIYTL